MDYLVRNESSRSPRPARLLGHGAHDLCGHGRDAGGVRLRLLRDRPGLLCHRLSVPAPLLSDPRSRRLPSSRRFPGFCLCALLLTGGATRERHLLRADFTSARSPAASLRAHPAPASAPVGGRKLEQNLNGDSKNEKIHLCHLGGHRPVLHGHGQARRLQMHGLRHLLPLRLHRRLLLKQHASWKTHTRPGKPGRVVFGVRQLDAAFPHSPPD
jgi:hypothetical protein